MSNYQLPQGYSLLDTTLKSTEYLKDPITFITKSMKKFGDTYTASLGPNRKLILTQDADFINYILKENQKNYFKSELTNKRAVNFFGYGLLFSNGEFWLKQRRLLQPAFHRKKLVVLSDIVINTIDELLADFPEGESVDIYPPVRRLSFSILIKSLFDIELSPDIMTELGTIFTELQDFLMRDLNKPLGRLFYPFTGAERRHLKKAKRLRTIFLDIINERKASQGEYSDILDMLLNSKYEDTGQPMSEDQMVDELLIMIFAGHETTANSLSWLLHLLSNHPENVEKLRASLEGKSIEESARDVYLNATINEGMRLYPASWISERVAVEDDQFKELSFPKGTIIAPFFFGLHRNSQLWKDELSFQPERFIEDGKVIKSKQHYPFGAGPRMCIGSNFAMMEMCYFLYRFFQKFDITSTGYQPKMQALLTLQPDQVILKVKSLSQ